MQSNILELEEWKRLWEDMQKTAEKIPDLKQQMLEELGGKFQTEVRRQIAISGLNDAKGRVQTWQNFHVGSGRGYVAVRADSVEVMSGGGNKKPLNAGALTNYLTSGHKTRTPSGKSKRYVPRVSKNKVPGFGFYKRASEQAEKLALEEAQEFLDTLKEELG